LGAAAYGTVRHRHNRKSIFRRFGSNQGGKSDKFDLHTIDLKHSGRDIFKQQSHVDFQKVFAGRFSLRKKVAGR